VGFAVVTWLWVLATSVERSVVSVMPGIFRGDLIVSSVRIGGGYVEAPVEEALIDELAGTSGVAVVVGEHATDWQYAGGPIGIDAFDARFFTDPRFERWPLVGPHLPSLWEAVAKGEMVIVSSNFTHNLGVHVGDRLQVETPSGPLTVQVGGMTHDFLSPRGTILMARELYRRHWHDTHITHALIRAEHGTDLAALRSAIARRAGSRYSLRILSVGELIDWFAGQVRRAFAAIYALGIMVLLVVAFGVADTVAAGVVERRRELAAMGAFGVRRASLARMILVEASLLGLCGVALALTTGLALGVVWVKATFPDLVGWVLELHMPALYFVLTAALAVGVCLVAAASPAYRSTRVQLAEALRYE
jgi:putative ABC transport system permease protein